MSVLITAFDWGTRFLLNPFDCTNELFNSLLGSSFLNSVNNIMTAIGVCLSVLLLVFGIYRILLGKINDDTPNIFSLLARFAFGIFMNFWSIDIAYDYILPIGQSVFDRVLAINTTAAVRQELVTQLQTLTNANSSAAISTNITKVLFDGNTLNSTTCLLIFFIIVMIAIVINILKLVIENAERYFVVNMLIITGPAAGSTLVSEKSDQIFKSWLQMLLSNIVTLILNLLGFKIILMGFSNCIKNLSSQNLMVALVSIVAMIALAKFVQKFDQLISQIMFKINPIQNRGLLMAGFAGLGTLTKGFETSGKMIDSIFGPHKSKTNQPNKFNSDGLKGHDGNTNDKKFDKRNSRAYDAANTAAGMAGTAAAGMAGAAAAGAVSRMRPKPNLSTLAEINDTLKSNGFDANMTPENRLYLDDLENNKRDFNLNELNDALGEHDRQISGLGVDKNGDKYLTVGQMADTDALNEDTVSRFVNNDNSIPSYVDLRESEVSDWQAANPDYHITSMEQAIGEDHRNRYYISTQESASSTYTPSTSANTSAFETPMPEGPANNNETNNN